MNDDPVHDDTGAGSERSVRRRAVLAGGIGNFVEWYDFALYGYFATTIAALFLPPGDPTAALLSTFVLFGVAFVIRPVGAIVFGHLGDRLGRRVTLMITILVMSGATVAMGLLPTYADIGAGAAVLLLLCRLLQGFSAGGEYAGANVFVIEHAPYRWRGRYAASAPVAVALGTAFAAGISLVITAATTAEQLAAWGWRIPFLVAGPLALVGLYLRLRVADSPVFETLREAGRVERSPLLATLRTARRPMAVLFGWTLLNTVAFYLLSAFLVSYLTTTIGFDKPTALLVMISTLLTMGACCLLAGLAIDRIGRKPVAVAAAVGLGLWAVPAFLIVQQGDLATTALAMAVFGAIFSGITTTSSLAIVELFDPPVRYTASSLAYQLSYTVFGGSAPYVATWMVGNGYDLGPAYYLAALAVVSAIVAVFGIGNRSAGSAPVAEQHEELAG